MMTIARIKKENGNKNFRSSIFALKLVLLRHKPVTSSVFLPLKPGNWSVKEPILQREAAEPFYFRLLRNLVSKMISSLANYRPCFSLVGLISASLHAIEFCPSSDS